MARFTKSQCRPCPPAPAAPPPPTAPGPWAFPPHTQELRDLQLRVRAEQQTPDWKTRYAVRSGVEGTINEFAHGHGVRHCRNRGQPKAHLQHVLTAIAVNIERLSSRSATAELSSPRPPTAFQSFLDQYEIPRSKSWRTLGTLSPTIQDPRQSQAQSRTLNLEDVPGHLPFVVRFGTKDAHRLLRQRSSTRWPATVRHAPTQDQHSMCGCLRLLAQLEHERPLRAEGRYPSYDGIADE